MNETVSRNQRVTADNELQVREARSPVAPQKRVCFGLLAVATGSTIARRIVVQKRPQIIIAAAFDRDLTSGIQDTCPLPVYGIFNRRPYGPCFNTQVPLAEVEMATRRFPGQQQ